MKIDDKTALFAIAGNIVVGPEVIKLGVLYAGTNFGESFALDLLR